MNIQPSAPADTQQQVFHTSLFEAKIYTVVQADEKTSILQETNLNYKIDFKIYGPSRGDIEKAFTTFGEMKKGNLGILLSGMAGAGKTVFIKLAIAKALELSYPVVIVKKPTYGLFELLNTINVPYLLVMDEMEKFFSMGWSDKIDSELTQKQLLLILDGLSSGAKRITLASVNSTGNMSSFFFRRPGRFFYHLRFGIPTVDVIKEYVDDHVRPDYRQHMNEIVGFCTFIGLSFDSLKAYTYELDHGTSMKEIMRTLNVVYGSGQTDDREGNTNLPGLWKKGHWFYEFTDGNEVSSLYKDDSDYPLAIYSDDRTYITIKSSSSPMRSFNREPEMNSTSTPPENMILSFSNCKAIYDESEKETFLVPMDVIVKSLPKNPANLKALCDRLSVSEKFDFKKLAISKIYWNRQDIESGDGDDSKRRRRRSYVGFDDY